MPRHLAVRNKIPSNVRRLIAAQAISLFGDAIAPIAITFAVLAHYRAGDLGLVLAARTVPMVALLFFGGVWADRLPRASVMVGCDVIRTATQAGSALLLVINSTPLWVLIVLQGVNGMATAFYRPASSGLVQQIVTAPASRQRTNALLSGANNLSSIAGPAVAGVVIGTASPALALVLDAATFAVCAVLTSTLKVRPVSRMKSSSVLADAASGMRYAKTRPWILRQIGAFSFFQLVAIPTYLVLGPVVLDQSYGGAAIWAVVVSTAGAGALIGDVVALRWSPDRPLVVANVACALSATIFVLLAFSSPLTLVLLGSGLYGFGMGYANVLWFTVLQHEVDPAFMSRISSLDWLGSVALRPLGLIAIAPAAELVGYTGTFAITATSVAVVMLLVASSRPVRRVRRYRDPAEGRRQRRVPVSADQRDGRERPGAAAVHQE